MCNNCKRDKPMKLSDSNIMNPIMVHSSTDKDSYAYVERKSRKHEDKNNLVINGYIHGSAFSFESRFEYCPYCGRKLR